MPEKAADGPPPSMASRCNAVIEGLRYILGHPLLPGLYALDWGMTAVSYYRELFPLFVAELFISGRLGESQHACIKPRWTDDACIQQPGNVISFVYSSYDGIFS